MVSLPAVPVTLSTPVVSGLICISCRSLIYQRVKPWRGLFEWNCLRNAHAARLSARWANSAFAREIQGFVVLKGPMACLRHAHSEHSAFGSRLS
jgi:hypothetical protein